MKDKTKEDMGRILRSFPAAPQPCFLAAALIPGPAAFIYHKLFAGDGGRKVSYLDARRRRALDDDGGTQPSMTLIGVAKGNQTIRVYVDDKVVKTFKVRDVSSVTKSFMTEIDLPKLKPGKHTLYVQSTDEVRRTSTIRQRIIFTIAKQMDRTSVKVGTKTQYVVRPGDSLWAIAERHLGDGRRYVELVSLNARTFTGLAEHPNIIQPGWTITIPAK